jgi:hypothetical protein
MSSRIVAVVVLMFLGCGRAAPAEARRKIVSEGQLRLVVIDLDAAQARLLDEVTRHGGLIAATDREELEARWTVRVPSDRFDEAIAALSSLGTVASVHTEAHDVTADFTDTEARLFAKQTEEARLLRLLETGQGGIQEVLAVEKELARVRSEAEELTRHSKLIASEVAMATLAVTATQSPALFGKTAPFSGELAGAFAASCGVLVVTLRGLGIALAAIAPWALLIGLPLAIRRRRAR